jgi:hypothetical protein
MKKTEESELWVVENFIEDLYAAVRHIKLKLQHNGVGAPYSDPTLIMSWFENEEIGKRDMKNSKAHCQGNIFGASNNDSSGADANAMSMVAALVYEPGEGNDSSSQTM